MWCTSNFLAALLSAALGTLPDQSLEEIFRAHVPFERNGPGIAALVLKDGEIVFEHCHGLADVKQQTEITPDTIFDLASVSKQFTAMAVMILQERAKLHYEDTLAHWCPEFPDYAQKITVRHLLQHTSGLPDYMELYSKPERKGERPTSAEVLELLAKQEKLVFEPGDQFQYSNSGYVVLAQIVERAADEPYPSFVKKNVLGPAKMNQTVVLDENVQTAKGRAKSYDRSFGGFACIDEHPLNLIYGDGAINTSLSQMRLWDRALGSEILVKQATLQVAWTSGTLNDGSKTGYGFGWSTQERAGELMVEHGGGWVGFRTFIVRVPSRKATVIVLSNYAGQQPARLGHALLDAVLGES